MRAVFMGSTEFSWHMLQELLRLNVEVAAVFSVHPRCAGNTFDYRDLSELTMSRHIPHFRVHTLETDANLARLHWLKPDVVLVMGFDRYVPPAALRVAPLGVIGSHASALPANRGRDPIPWSILTGEETGGLSFYHLIPGYDDGDVVLQRSWPITVSDSAASLYRRMISTGREMIHELVRGLSLNSLPRRSQDPALANVLPCLDPDCTRIDWAESARRCYDGIRAMTHPYPGAFTQVEGRKLTVWKAFLSHEGSESAPGEVMGLYEKGVEVACGAGSIILQIVQIGDGPEEPARPAFDRMGVCAGYLLGQESTQETHSREVTSPATT